MNYYEEVQKYEKQIARKRYIRPRLPMLKDKRLELLNMVKELEKKKRSEDEDVKRMEGHSLAAFLYTVMGKRQEVLDKERREAYEATTKYNVALAELEAIERDIHHMEDDLGCYANAEKNYEEALLKWMNQQAIMPMTEELSKELRECQRLLGEIQARKKEIKEGKRATEAAIVTAEYIVSGLDNAHSWGVFDAFFNGGLFADMIKYEQIDQVEEDIQRFHVQLYNVQKELKDIKIQGHIETVSSRDTRFVDMFFDNIFIDCGVMGDIKRTKESTQIMLAKLKDVVKKIEIMEDAVLEEETKVKERLAKALSKQN